MKNKFHSWLGKHSDPAFWKQPLASTTLDQLLKDKKMRVAIDKSEKNQKYYSALNHEIAKDYAQLIDTKLREAINSLNLGDFDNLDWYEKIARANIRQKNYHNVRSVLEHWIIQDVEQHTHIASKLSAFKRWIKISECLLTSHCYEGFFLVFPQVHSLAKPNYLNELPEMLLQDFKEFDKLCSPVANFKCLRQYIIQNKHNRDLPPILLWYQSFNRLNESVQQVSASTKEIEEKVQGLDRSLSNLQLDDADTNELQIDSITLERNRTSKDLMKLQENIGGLTDQRKLILNEIKFVIEHSFVMPIPDYLEQSYHQLIVSYNKQNGTNIPLPDKDLEREKLVKKALLSTSLFTTNDMSVVTINEATTTTTMSDITPSSPI